MPVTTFAAAAGATAVEVVPALANYVARIVALDLSFSADVSFLILKNDGTTGIQQFPLVKAGTPYTRDFGNAGPVQPTTGEAIKIKTSAAANMTGTVTYRYDPPKRTTYVGA